jgi:hypothetical protein
MFSLESGVKLADAEPARDWDWQCAFDVSWPIRELAQFRSALPWTA